MSSLPSVVNVWAPPGKEVRLSTGQVVTDAGAYAPISAEVINKVMRGQLLNSGSTPHDEATVLSPENVQSIDTHVADFMAQSGGGGVLCKAAAAAVASVTPSIDGTLAYVRGHAAAGDGGHGHFVWNINSTATIDGCLALGDPAKLGRWERVRVSKELNVRWFGAKGDGVADDTAAIQAAIDAMTSQVSTLFFPFGQYKITKNLVVGAAGITGWGQTFLGESAGINNENWPGLIWAGVAADKGTAMVQVRGFDHVFMGLRFDGRGTGHGQTNCKRGGMAIGGEGAWALGASNITVDRCQFVGVEIGIGFSLDGTVTGNLEQCKIVDCGFLCYEAGIWVRRGQPYNTSIIRPVFARFPPAWQSVGVTGGVANPYGIGVYIWGDGNNTSGTVWIDTPNFNYLAIGVYSPGSCSNLTIKQVDSENTKRLLWTVGGLGQNCSYLIENGRYETGANDVSTGMPGVTYNNTLDIPATEYDYIKIGSGNLVLKGNGFASLSATGRFKITCEGSANLVSQGNYYPNIRPFNRTATSVANGTQSWYGGTFSEGDNANSQVPNAGAGVFTPDPQIPSYTIQSLPALRGCENGDGYVDISGTATTAAVTFAVAEPQNRPADAQSCSYQVALTVMQVTSGAVVSQPYVTAPTAAGFTINVVTAPGVGKKVRIAYALSRSPRPYATLV